MEIDETKMVNWLDFFKVTYDYQSEKEKKTFVRRHVSGHASQSELKELIRQNKPKNNNSHSHNQPRAIRKHVCRQSNFAQICSTNRNITKSEDRSLIEMRNWARGFV